MLKIVKCSYSSCHNDRSHNVKCESCSCWSTPPLLPYSAFSWTLTTLPMSKVHTHTEQAKSALRMSAVCNHWTGLVDWTGGLDQWTDTKNNFYAFQWLSFACGVVWKSRSFVSIYIHGARANNSLPSSNSIREGLCTQCAMAFCSIYDVV